MASKKNSLATSPPPTKSDAEIIVEADNSDDCLHKMKMNVSKMKKDKVLASDKPTFANRVPKGKFECHYCKKIFKTKQSIVKHVRSIHK